MTIASKRPTQRRFTRDEFENRFFGIIRWLVIAGLLIVTVFPFYYMGLLSVTYSTIPVRFGWELTT